MLPVNVSWAMCYFSLKVSCSCYRFGIFTHCKSWLLNFRKIETISCCIACLHLPQIIHLAKAAYMTFYKIGSTSIFFWNPFFISFKNYLVRLDFKILKSNICTYIFRSVLAINFLKKIKERKKFLIYGFGQTVWQLMKSVPFFSAQYWNTLCDWDDSNGLNYSADNNLYTEVMMLQEIYTCPLVQHICCVLFG